MADECLAVRGALRTINQASHHALVSCSRELHEVNFVVARALLSLSSNTQSSITSNEKDSHNTIAAGITTTQNTESTYLKPQSEAQNVIQKYRLWPSKSENALVSLAQCWLQSKTMGLEERGGLEEFPLALRKAVISNSPA
jgi:hypothetical protein